MDRRTHEDARPRLPEVPSTADIGVRWKLRPDEVMEIARENRDGFILVDGRQEREKLVAAGHRHLCPRRGRSV